MCTTETRKKVTTWAKTPQATGHWTSDWMLFLWSLYDAGDSKQRQFCVIFSMLINSVLIICKRHVKCMYMYCIYVCTYVYTHAKKYMHRSSFLHDYKKFCTQRLQTWTPHHVVKRKLMFSAISKTTKYVNSLFSNLCFTWGCEINIIGATKRK